MSFNPPNEHLLYTFFKRLDRDFFNRLDKTVHALRDVADRFSMSHFFVSASYNTVRQVFPFYTVDGEVGDKQIVMDPSLPDGVFLVEGNIYKVYVDENSLEVFGVIVKTEAFGDMILFPRTPEDYGDVVSKIPSAKSILSQYASVEPLVSDEDDSEEDVDEEPTRSDSVSTKEFNDIDFEIIGNRSLELIVSGYPSSLQPIVVDDELASAIARAVKTHLAMKKLLNDINRIGENLNQAVLNINKNDSSQ